jgi:phasin family protein
MNLISQQNITPALKAHMAAQSSFFTDMTQKMFQAAQRVNELNIQLARAMVEETVTSAQQVMVADDTYEAMAIAAAQVTPTADKVRAYQQHLNSIAVGAQVDLSKTAEQHVTETTRTASALAEDVARRASEETEKATQRQKAAMEKLTNPIQFEDRSDGSDQQQRGRSGSESMSAAAQAQARNAESQGAQAGRKNA